jgi:hypothetical protein
MAIDVSFLDPAAVTPAPAQFQGCARSTGSFSHRATKIKTSWTVRRIPDEAGLVAASLFRTKLGGKALRAVRSICLDITPKQ